LVTLVAVAQQDGLAARSEQAQIPAGIHRTGAAGGRTQGRDRPVDRVALGDPAEIERQWRAP